MYTSKWLNGKLYLFYQNFLKDSENLYVEWKESENENQAIVAESRSVVTLAWEDKK